MNPLRSGPFRPTRRRVGRGDLSLILASLALVVAVSGITPADAARTAKKLLNADSVDGVSASRTPKAGQLLPLGSDGKLPASVLPPGVPGPRGPRGAEGPAGASGAAGGAGRTVFRAHAVAAQSMTNKVMHKVLFGGEDFDPDNIFDPGTSTFTAPAAGYYRFEASVLTSFIQPTAAPQRTLLQIKSSREPMTVRGTDEHGTGYQQATGTGLMRLERGDTVWVDLYVELAENSGDAPRAIDYGPETAFSGSLVAPA